MEAKDYPKHNMKMQSEGLEKVCPYDPKVGLDKAKCPHYMEVRDH